MIKPLVYIIEDDPLMADCLALNCRQAGAFPVIFGDAIAAITALSEQVPALIFLDILLTGPNGFTFLHEMLSYQDTAKIPVVILSSLDLTQQNLTEYGVVEVLNKESFLPKDIQRLVRAYTAAEQEGE